MIPPTDRNSVDYIHNADFINWVLKPTRESDQYWSNYILENPLEQKELENSRLLIKSLIKKEKSLSESDIQVLWNKIESTRAHRKTRYIILKKWSVAAGILFILGISGWLTTQLNSSGGIQSIDYKNIAVNADPGGDIKLILADHSQKTFSAKDVEIKYSEPGKLQTKTGLQIETEELQQSSTKLQFNQLDVPRGKRSNIVLADGTKLWLNSGSRAIYPVSFNGNTREIYIEGEGYLEVAHDNLKPFYVVTDQIKVKVLGTKFDISSYKDDCRTSVVLVEGSIEATYGSDNIIMKPNDLFNYQKTTHQVTVEKTNVLPYISWKDGWMLCNKEPIHMLTRKISRYYDVKISYTDARVNNMTLTGKLDLKSNFEDVLKIICTTAPLKYEIIGNSIFLTVKEKNKVKK